MSVNSVSVEQLSLACRHVDELLRAGMTENLAIRNLELFVDVYAKIARGGSATPHHVSQVELWSKAALQLRKQKPDGRPGGLFRVEHGTPRRELARRVLALSRAGKLNESAMRRLVNRGWRLAVITIEEDRRLNRIARSRAFASPSARWKAAGIKF